MDISILIGNIAIFLPLIFALFLILARITLQYINKNILNWGMSIVNLLSLLFFIYLKIFQIKNTNINFGCEIFSLGELKLNFGIIIDNLNIDFLIYSALVYFLISIFAIIYFNKKRQFFFTKHRYNIFLGLLSFNTYFFICSYSLIQSFIFWVIQGILIFLFAYFDILKNYANYNITRFYRIFLIGDILFLTSLLILYKYAILSQGYIQSTSLNYSELNELISYTYGISNSIEFIICILCFIGAIMTRMLILPFCCFYSFIANSSNILYLSIITCANSVFGCLLLFKCLPIFEFIQNSLLYFKILIIISIISSFIFLVFEKNTKIFFGYVLSIINSLFIYSYLTYNKENSLITYALANFIILLFIAYLVYYDKTTIKKHFLIKQKGFILEKIHITIFEKFIDKISSLFNFINDKITKNLILTTLKIFDYILSLFVLKNLKNNSYKILRNIFIIFAVITLITIFIALFGER